MRREAWRAALSVLALTLPWLWPLASGPWPAAQQAIWSLACAGLLLILRALAWPRLAAAAAAAWLLAGLISALIGLIQYFGWSAALAPWVNETELGEAFANLRQRNQFASLTSLGLVALMWGRPGALLGLGARVAAPGAGLAPGMGAGLAPAAAALLAVANAASGSRTGMLQLLLLGALVWIWRRSAPRSLAPVLLSALLAYLLASIVLPLLLGMSPAEHGIASRLRAESIPCGSRLVLWGNVLHLIAQRPWTGWGWGELDYAHFMAVYPGERFCEILDNAHNLPLHLAVELGLPVAALVCLAGIYLAWRARPWTEADPTRRMAWAALAVIGVHSLLEYPLWYGPFQLATAGAIVLLLQRPATARVEPTGTPGVDRAGLGPLSTALGAAAVLAALYTAWDYHRVSQIYVAPERRAPYYMSNTLAKIRDSWLFSNQVRFAELVTTDLSRGNAVQVQALAEQMLHFSPEARVVEKLIESSALLGDDAQARLYLARYRTAFPKEHALWATRQLLEGIATEPLRRLVLP